MKTTQITQLAASLTDLAQEPTYAFDYSDRLTRSEYRRAYIEGRAARYFASDFEAYRMRREVEAELNAHS